MIPCLFEYIYLGIYLYGSFVYTNHALDDTQYAIDTVVVDNDDDVDDCDV